MKQIVIRTVANGYEAVEDNPIFNFNPGAKAETGYVFEDFESLVDWLEENLDNPKEGIDGTESTPFEGILAGITAIDLKDTVMRPEPKPENIGVATDSQPYCVKSETYTGGADAKPMWSAETALVRCEGRARECIGGKGCGVMIPLSQIPSEKRTVSDYL